MDPIEAAKQAGITEAQADIAAGQPRLRYGARGAWGEDLEATLRSRFSVELVELSCFVTAETQAFDAAYNSTIEAHIDKIHGPGSVAAVWTEVQHRRKQAYDAWVESEKHDDSSAALDLGGLA
jgi:hypothetical protein